MTRYILIDEHSGFVWGDVVAADPIAACRALDEGVGEYGRTYEEIGARRRFDGRSGYHVHEAPADFPAVDDGQDQATIDAVTALPLIERVVTA